MQSHAEAVRYLVADQPRTDELRRRATEHHVRLQLLHLRTYPTVAAALACGRLHVFCWLHDDALGELFYPATEQGRFDRRVALHPEHNRDLRDDRPRPAQARYPWPRLRREQLYLA